ncbi:MAG: MBG domain-containing protein [Bacteroidales bacterium]
MRKKQLRFTTPPAGYYQLMVKFKNLLTWVDNLIFTGRFWEFTLKQQQRVVAKLRALYTKLSAINHPLALKVAGAATCFLLFAGTAKAQTPSFVKKTGINSPINFTDIYGMHTASGEHCYIKDGVFADVDKDGDLDLVILATSQYETKIAYFENVNGQYIENSNDNPFSGLTASYSIDIIDVDADENLDIVLTYEGSGSRINHFEFNAESGEFEYATGSGVIGKRYALTGVVDNLNVKFLDINADGLPDMVCSGVKDGNNYIGTFFQNADHSFGDIQDNVPIQASQMPDGQYQMAVADMDRDGDKDLIIYAPYATGFCSYFRNNGDATFTKVTETANIPLPLAQLSQKSILIPGDIDNDNQTDIFQPGNQSEDVFYNDQAFFSNTTISLPVAENEYLNLYFDNYPYTVTPAMVLANDAINYTEGTLVAKFISSTNGGIITANGINYYDVLTTEGYHRVTYRIGNALTPGDTVWGNTTETGIFPVPLQVAMVSDSTGDLSINLNFNTSINYSAYAIYGKNTITLESPGLKRGPATYTLPNYTAGDTIKIYGYGITYFIADSIQLNYLDASRCSSLGGLSCCSNHLTYLDVSKNTNLYKFSCSNNLIDTLYLPPLGDDGSELEVDHNYLKTLILPAYASYLNVSYNLLDTLDISQVNGLSTLICQYNNLKQLTLGTNNELAYLVCNNNQLTSLDLAGVENLMTLMCQNNSLTSLNVSNKPSLFYLECQNNQLNLATLPQNSSQYVVNPTIGMGGYNYAPQAPVNITYDYYNRVDLSDEYMIYDAENIAHQTEFTWITTAGVTLVEGTDYFMNEGYFTFFANLTDSIYCTMYNAALPQLHGDSVLYTVKIMPSAAKLTKTMVSQANGNLSFEYVDYAGEFFIDYGSGIKQVTSAVMSKSSVVNSKDGSSKVSENDSYTIANYIAGTPINIYGPGIGRLYIDSLSLTELNVSHLTQLYRIYCNSNLLTQLDISNNKLLYILDCSNNKFDFVTLPWAGYIEKNVSKADSEDPYIYAPQAKLSAIVNNGLVDLSSQLTAYDSDSVLHITTYVWFTKDGSVLSSDYYTESNGQFRFIQTPVDSVYCVMANDTYPLFVNENALRTQLLKIEAHRPIIISMPEISINEDEPVNLDLTKFTVDYYNQSLLAIQILAGNNYSFNGTTITPTSNFNGTLPVTIMVVDGNIQSEEVTINLTVNPVNDAPVLSAVTSKTINEDGSLTLALTDATASDVETDELTLVVLSGDNYSVDQTVVTPTSGFYGQLVVPVYVTDGELNSDTLNVEVTVVPVPTTPVITWETPVTTVYGGSIGNAVMNAATTANGTITYSFSADSVFDAGTHTLTAWFTPNEANDYNAISKITEYVVTKAGLTVTANDQAIQFGSTIPELTYTYNGFVNNENESVLDTKPVASTTATSESSAGEYDIIVSGGSDNNYSFTYVKGTLTINEKVADPELSVSVATLVMGNQDNSTATFDITSNIDWSVESSESWLHANPENGNGNKTITLNADENSTAESRSATITVTGTGVASQTITVTQDASVGIDDNTMLTINIYPNPGNSWVNIQLPNGIQKATLEIYNTVGTKIHQVNLNTTENQVNVSELNQGIYIFRIMADKQTKLIRWIKN